MKTTLFTVALILASYFSNAQRIFESTYGSWDYPNLSVETYKDFVISGYTERNPSNGLLTPTFKISTINGSPVATYHVNYSDAFYLLDFTVREKNNSIILVGMTQAGFPHKMVVTEIDFMTGTPYQSSIEYPVTNATPIGHQIIHSEPAKQVVIVGTNVYEPLTPDNFPYVSKTGFILSLDINNFNTVNFTTETNMSAVFPANEDYDMLENVTEVPGQGYFMSGSCNGPTGNQHLMTMGVDYSGNPIFSNIFDKSNFRSAGSSVMYYKPLDVVYLMANNSSLNQFQITICQPNNGMPVIDWISHPMTSLPIGNGINQNGFRLQHTPDKFIVVGGYLDAPSGILSSILTPFQITMREDLKFVAAKTFQSDNNSPLSPSYFEEDGKSPFINTPDMIVYNQYSKRTYLVNQNKNYGGFDLHVSSLIKPSKCEKEQKVSTFKMPHNVMQFQHAYPIQMFGASYFPNPIQRPIMEHIICNEIAPLPMVTAPNAATLYPNPASLDLRISLDDETIQGVVVYDMKGNAVLSEKATEHTRNSLNLNVGKLNQGAYIIEITTEEGTIHHEKFVKE